MTKRLPPFRVLFEFQAFFLPERGTSGKKSRESIKFSEEISDSSYILFRIVLQPARKGKITDKPASDKSRIFFHKQSIIESSLKKV